MHVIGGLQKRGFPICELLIKLAALWASMCVSVPLRGFIKAALRLWAGWNLWLDYHPGWLESIPGWLDFVPGWLEFLPGWLEFIPGWLEFFSYRLGEAWGRLGECFGDAQGGLGTLVLSTFGFSGPLYIGLSGPLWASLCVSVPL